MLHGVLHLKSLKSNLQLPEVTRHATLELVPKRLNSTAISTCFEEDVNVEDFTDDASTIDNYTTEIEPTVVSPKPTKCSLPSSLCSSKKNQICDVIRINLKSFNLRDFISELPLCLLL